MTTVLVTGGTGTLRAACRPATSRGGMPRPHPFAHAEQAERHRRSSRARATLETGRGPGRGRRRRRHRRSHLAGQPEGRWAQGPQPRGQCGQARRRRRISSSSRSWARTGVPVVERDGPDAVRLLRREARSGARQSWVRRIPWTVLRATQFHELGLLTLRAAEHAARSRSSSAGIRFQPIAAAEVGRAVDRNSPSAGPVRSRCPTSVARRRSRCPQLMRSYLASVGRRAPILPIPVGGGAGRAHEGRGEPRTRSRGRTRRPGAVPGRASPG